jgi:ribosomal protein L29
MPVITDLENSFADVRQMSIDELNRAIHDILQDCFSYRRAWERCSKRHRELMSEKARRT